MLKRTYVPALNHKWVILLCAKAYTVGRTLDTDTRKPSQATYQNIFGQDHDKCKSLRNNLADSSYAISAYISVSNYIYQDVHLQNISCLFAYNIKL